MSGSFNIIGYLAGLTGFVFDKDVLTRVAVECGVSDITIYEDMTEEQKDFCKIALLETVLLTPHGTASHANKHGNYEYSVGSQTITEATLENIKGELRRLYKKHGLLDKLDALDDIRCNLQWM